MKPVKINYTVDFDDIPDVITKFLNESKKKLEEYSKLTIDLDNIEGTLNQIETLRKGLYMVDARLSDCNSILAGFLQSKMKEKTQPEQQVEILDDEAEIG